MVPLALDEDYKRLVDDQVTMFKVNNVKLKNSFEECHDKLSKAEHHVYELGKTNETVQELAKKVEEAENRLREPEEHVK